MDRDQTRAEGALPKIESGEATQNKQPCRHRIYTIKGPLKAVILQSFRPPYQTRTLFAHGISDIIPRARRDQEILNDFLGCFFCCFG